MRRLALILAACSALGTGTGAATAAEDVVLGLSQSQVQITTNFNGSEILVYGAVKRETPIPETALDVIVTVAGPFEPVMVHRKARVAGIWVNAESVLVDRAPSFYAIASSGPLDEVLSHTEDLRQAITTPRAIRSVGAMAEDPAAFTNALIRIRREAGTYATFENSVDVVQQTLFSTSIALPANLVEGGHLVRVFLLRNKQVVTQFDTVIEVRKVGLERWLYALAQDQALAYGILSLILAAGAGWGASAAFRLLR